MPRIVTARPMARVGIADRTGLFERRHILPVALYGGASAQPLESDGVEHKADSDEGDDLPIGEHLEQPPEGLGSGTGGQDVDATAFPDGGEPFVEGPRLEHLGDGREGIVPGARPRPDEVIKPEVRQDGEQTGPCRDRRHAAPLCSY